MHQTFVLDCDWHHHVLKCILMLSFDRQDGAQVFIVMLPEYHILDRLQPVEYGGHRDLR